MPEPQINLEISAETGLDPSDWSAFRNLAHRMVDDIVDELSSLREQPVWQPMPVEVSFALTSEPLPRQGQGEQKAYQDFLENVLPFSNGNRHPRFYGWVQGNGVPLANMADMLASAMNPNVAGHNQAPALVEKKVIDWIAELMGFPSHTSGVLESGGTMANILGLAVARQNRSGFDTRALGLQLGETPLAVYCSTETHGWVQKGVEFLGIGSAWLRMIRVDEQFQIDLEALATAVEMDLANGIKPLCVVGTAGTVNTGAIDDLEALGDFCEAHGLWFHVDGAFGALAKISPVLAPRIQGLERADSLAVDLHKWMYLPFEIACLLVKDPLAHTSTFAFTPTYLAELDRGIMAGGLPFSDRGIDLTRGFKALKAWMCLKAFGADKFATIIEQNVAQTRALAEKIERDPRLELLAPVPLNVACFRVVQEGLSEEELDSLNLETLLRVQEGGVAAPSSTRINGKFAIRFCNVNHRSRREDIDIFLDEVLTQSQVILSSA
jgi:aromatic-L-amino-acid decarboxylase